MQRPDFCATPEGTAGVAASIPPVAGAEHVPPRWNLADLYRGDDDPAITADLARLAEQAAEFAQAFRGRIGQLAGIELGAAIEEYQEIEQALGRLHAYGQLRFAGDQTAPGVGPFVQTLREKANAIDTELVFFTLELMRIEDKALETMLGEPALTRFAPFLRDLRIFLPHILSDEIETLLHEKDVTGHAAWARLFDETIARLRISIGDEELTLSAALNRLSDPDRSIRALAARRIGNALEREAPVFALILNTIAKDKAIIDRKRGYTSPIAARNLGNRVEDTVIEALTKAVVEAYPRLAHRYYALKAGWLGLPKLAHWDRNAPLPDEDEQPIPWPRAMQIVLDAYARFDPEMAASAAPFFERSWIDAEPRPGKASGAFAHPTVPDAHPYILLNYHGRSRDVMTLAHELGHGVHQRLAAPQGYLMAGTPLTLAETASVFGEMLTFRALLDATSDPAQRRLLLANKVEDMLNTVVRQIAFLRFEQRFHAERANGEVGPARIGAIWLEVQHESLGPAFEFSEEYRLYWSYVPHFVHSPFYVYAYAFGDCLVNALYRVYQDCCAAGAADTFIANYRAMLRAGGTKTYRELLAPFGIDPADPAFWARGLDQIDLFITALED